MFGPVIRGTKVILRPPRGAELERYIEWFGDMEVTRFLGVRTPPSLQQEEDWMKRAAEDRNMVVWAIEFDGKLIGATGIHQIDWVNGHAVTGIVIGERDQWRKGIASEVMALRTRFAFCELNLHKLKSRAFMDNEASKRALQKAGYRQSGVERAEMFREGRWHDMWVGEVLREDWERENSR
jgi:ribosomal-protein-alanine N-acetyltransferase